MSKSKKKRRGDRREAHDLPPKRRKAVHVPILLITSIALIVFGLGSYAWHAYQVRRTSSDLLDLADSLEEEAEWNKAAQYIDRYLEIVPEDVQAVIRRAEAFDRSADTIQRKVRAAQLYAEALAIAPASQKIELHRRLGTLLLELGQYQLQVGASLDTAAEEAQLKAHFQGAREEALAVLDELPDDPEALRVLALALIGLERRDSLGGLPEGFNCVAGVFEDALEQNPGDIELSANLAEVYREHEDLLQEPVGEAERITAADEVMDRMVSHDPNKAEAFLARYRYRAEYGSEGAIDDLEKALELGPDFLPARLAAGRAYQLAAQADAQRGARQTAQEKYDLARQHYEYARKVAPTDPRAHLGLGDLYREQGKAELAVEALSVGRAQAGGENPALNAALAEAILSLPEPRVDELAGASECIEALDRVAARARTQTSDLTRRDLEGYIDRLRAWLAVRQGRGLARAGERQKAEAKYRDAATLLQRTLSATDRQALQDRVSAWRLLEQCHRVLGQWEDAASSAEELVRLMPEAVEPLLSAAASWLAAGRPEKAIRHIERALAIQESGEVRLLLAIAQLQEQQGTAEGSRDWAPLEGTLDLLETENQKKRIPRGWQIPLLRVHFLTLRSGQGAEQGKLNTEVLEVLREAELEYPDSAELFEQLVAFYRRHGADTDAGRALAKSGWLSQLAARDFEAMENQEEELRASEGAEGLAWRYYRARRLLAQADRRSDPRLDEALALLAKIESGRADWLAACTLQGLVLEAKGDYSGAVDCYRRTIDLGAPGTFGQERLIANLAQIERYEEAEEALKAVKSSGEFSDRLRALELIVKDRQGERNVALQLAQQEAEARPDDAGARLRWARLLALDGQTEAAETALKDAVLIAPTDPRPLAALFDLYARANRPEEAKAVLAKVAESPGLSETRRKLVLANGHPLLGDLETAEQNLREAVEAEPDNTDLRLRLADVLVRRELPDALEEAKRLVNEVLNSQPDLAEAKRLLAAVLLAEGGDANVGQAIQLMDQLASASANPADLYALGRLRDSQADWEAADRLFAALAELDSRNPGALALYVNRLLGQGRLEEAKARLEELERLAPDDVRTMRLWVRWLKEAGQTEKIATRIQGFEDRLLQLAADDEARREEVPGIVGDLYSLAGQPQAAEPYYRSLVASDPSRYDLLAMCLARQGRFEEAVGLCVEASSSDPGPRPANVVCAALLSGQPSAADFRKAEALFEKQVTAPSPDPEFLFRLATLRIVEGRPEEAIPLYEKVVQLRPKDAMALNNLAMLLSDVPGRTEDALSAVDRALKIAGQRPSLLDTKAVILLGAGKTAEAGEILEKVSSGPDRDPRYFLHLAAAYARLGETEKAQTALTASLEGGLAGEILTVGDRSLLEETKTKLGTDKETSPLPQS